MTDNSCMTIQSRLRGRLEALLNEGETLRAGGMDGYARDVTQRQLCSGWLTSAQHIVQLITPNLLSPYRMKVDSLARAPMTPMINHAVGEVVEVLKSLIVNVDAGLLTSIVNSAQAEVFDEFLDHASEYVKRGRKEEGGVIAGVVFEDTIRRICKRMSIQEAGVKLDQLISALANGGVISGVKAKRARAAAAVRTSATHAQWTEFEISDVEATIQTTKELIDAHLDS